jgi:nucleolar protein 6
MKTCLKLYHHSKLSDGVAPARRINVELTAGGGGHGELRRTRISEKNQKLNDERKREADRRRRERGEKTDDAGEGKAEGEAEGKMAVKQDVEENAKEGGMHPSRMNRMNR